MLKKMTELLELLGIARHITVEAVTAITRIASALFPMPERHRPTELRRYGTTCPAWAHYLADKGDPISVGPGAYCLVERE